MLPRRETVMVSMGSLQLFPGTRAAEINSDNVEERIREELTIRQGGLYS